MRELQAVAQPGAKPNKHNTPLIAVHNSIWQRLGTRERYLRGLELYCDGAVRQVVDSACKRLPTVKEMIETRRETIASLPFFALMEYAEHMDVPDTIFAHPVIKRLHRVATDLALL
jgi:hypothetical protein